jgi:pilus assembly protein Flp/PilA
VSEEGPTAVEYAAILTAIVIACLMAVTTLGTNANGTFNKVGSSIQPGQQQTAGPSASQNSRSPFAPQKPRPAHLPRREVRSCLAPALLAPSAPNPVFAAAAICSMIVESGEMDACQPRPNWCRSQDVPLPKVTLRRCPYIGGATFTEEMVIKAKPAENVVKVTALKGLKDLV